MFILRQGGGVAERLANVFLLQVRQVRHNLCRRHAVGNKVDNVRDRDAKATDGGSPGHDIRVVRNPIECIRHSVSFTVESNAGEARGARGCLPRG